MNNPLLLVLILNVGLSRCAGTEVGNGAKKDPVPEKATEQAQGTNNTLGKGDPIMGSVLGAISLFLFVPCASPFAENISGTFNDANGKEVFKVVMSSEVQRQVTAIISQQEFHLKVAPTGASPYAIEALANSPTLSCGPITSQTLVDGKIERSVLLSDKTLLSWTLEGISVKSIKLIHPDNREEIWTKSSD